MSQEAVVARKGPFGVVVQKGKTYWWCACGLSKSQPFCDGSHKGTQLRASQVCSRRQSDGRILWLQTVTAQTVLR